MILRTTLPEKQQTRIAAGDPITSRRTHTTCARTAVSPDPVENLPRKYTSERDTLQVSIYLLIFY